jgi:hypothetical protein
MIENHFAYRQVFHVLERKKDFNAIQRISIRIAAKLTASISSII